MIKRLYTKWDGGQMVVTGCFMGLVFSIIYTSGDLQNYSKFTQYAPLFFMGVGLLLVGLGLRKIFKTKNNKDGI